MTLLLPCLLLLHLTVLILLYTATINNSWYLLSDGSLSDLWYDCSHTQDSANWACNSSVPSSGEEWLHAVQGAMVISVVFSTVSAIIFLCQLYALRRGSLFYVTAIFQIFAGLCVGCAALIYTLHVTDLHPADGGSFGHSYIIAWTTLPLTLASGIMYIHLRKLE